MLKLLTPQVELILAALLIAGSFYGGWSVNGWHRDSQALIIERAADKAGQKATDAVVEKIGTLRPQFTTIQGKVEREIFTDIRYRDCVHTDVTWGLLDSAYQAAGGKPFGSGTGVPAPTPAH